MSSSSNPLSVLTDHELLNAQIVLAIACGRSHSSLSKRRRQFFCILLQALANESTNRGHVPPGPPWHAPTKAQLDAL